MTPEQRAALNERAKAHAWDIAEACLDAGIYAKPPDHGPPDRKYAYWKKLLYGPRARAELGHTTR
jgi:hypothetical protein